ncbi:MAG: hypothetical protein ACRDTE_11180 [Pseudonocardiaceae bacterium]
MIGGVDVADRDGGLDPLAAGVEQEELPIAPGQGVVDRVERAQLGPNLAQLVRGGVVTGGGCRL